MNVLGALFGIFRQGGLVAWLIEGRSLKGFFAGATLASLLGGLLYGFAMGIGLSTDTAVKDAVKVTLVMLLALGCGIPLFLLAYRLLGREERPGHVAAVPLTVVLTVAVVLAVTAPVVFMLSVLAGFSPEAIYIHVVIIDLAVLVGIYVAGTLIFHAFTTDRAKLIVPNVIGFVMLGVLVVVLIAFFEPFLALSPTFSVGTDRLMDGLGFGVSEKVDRALAAAATADRVAYRFQTTNANGDLERDYTVTRAGADYHVRVYLQAVPGGPVLKDRNIWLLDGAAYTDFDGGRVRKTGRGELGAFLDAALPPTSFRLPEGFSQAGWRAYSGDQVYVATGTTADRARAMVTQDLGTRRLKDLVIGSSQPGVHAETRAVGLAPGALDRGGLETQLNRAEVVGNVDRSDASLETYVQGDTFFAVRYPRTWRAGSWSAGQRRVEFAGDCPTDQPCPVLQASVYDLTQGKGPRQYAEDLARGLELQPAFRQAAVSTPVVGGSSVGLVEYLQDRTVKGEIETTRHAEYVFVGRYGRYHLNFSVRADRFDAHRGLFAEMAGQFVYLR